LRNAIIVSALLSACVFATNRTDAGEWLQLPNQDGLPSCQFLFRGRIEVGDLTTIEGLSGWRECGSDRLVYLDSPGGNLGEVVSFLESGIGAYSFPTRIRAGESCLSACAILFMYGRNSGGSSTYIDRSLAPGAELGFHTPFVADEILNQIGGAASFRSALEVSSLLLVESYSINTINDVPALPPELIQIMLNTPSDEMYLVDTVGELTLLEIGHVGTSLNVSTDSDLERRIIQACVGSYVFFFRQHLLPEGYDFGSLIELTEVIMERSDEFLISSVDDTEDAWTAAERLSVVVSGPLYRPGPGSAGTSILDCEVVIYMNAISSGFEVSSYQVYFGRPDPEAPEFSRDFSGASVGMALIDTPYNAETVGNMVVSADAMNNFRRNFDAGE
jgi:hypothetical protein